MKKINFKLFLSFFLVTLSLNTYSHPLELAQEAGSSLVTFCNDNKKLIIGIAVTAYGIKKVRDYANQFWLNLQALKLPLAERPEHMWPKTFLDLAIRPLPILKKYNYTYIEHTIAPDGTKQEITHTIETNCLEALKEKLQESIAEWHKNIDLIGLEIMPSANISYGNFFNLKCQILNRMIGNIIPFTPIRCQFSSFNTYKIFGTTKAQFLDEIEAQVINCFSQS